MTQEEKELLLIDLCGRLPYEVIVGYSTKDNPNILDKIGRVIYVDIRFGMIQMQSESGTSYGLPPSEFIKPYLRPMSSMTEEEEYEYHQIRKRNSDKSLSLMDCNDHLQQLLFPIIVGTESIDWLNKKMFDYRGLIHMNLALEAPNGMYK